MNEWMGGWTEWLLQRVDFIQCFVLELPDRPGAPVYCCERLIAGVRGRTVCPHTTHTSRRHTHVTPPHTSRRHTRHAPHVTPPRVSIIRARLCHLSRFSTRPPTNVKRDCPGRKLKKMNVINNTNAERECDGKGDESCVEEYIKYNNNSGYIDEEHLRSTPQAFSHFTFHESKGAEMVVDVQGVGDLYTDPQFHTVDGEEYGEGNLGPRGMASFLSTHHCDDLCRLLDLPPFVLSPKRRREMQAGHLEHVRHVQELEEKGREGGEGLVAIGEEGEGGGGRSAAEVSSTGGTAGGSSAQSGATTANVSSADSSKETTPAATAFRARGAMLQAGASSKLGSGRKNGSNPLLATLFRQATATALSLIGGGDSGT